MFNYFLYQLPHLQPALTQGCVVSQVASSASYNFFFDRVHINLWPAMQTPADVLANPILSTAETGAFDSV